MCSPNAQTCNFWQGQDYESPRQGMRQHGARFNPRVLLWRSSWCLFDSMAHVRHRADSELTPCSFCCGCQFGNTVSLQIQDGPLPDAV